MRISKLRIAKAIENHSEIELTIFGAIQRICGELIIRSISKEDSPPWNMILIVENMFHWFLISETSSIHSNNEERRM